MCVFVRVCALQKPWMEIKIRIKGVLTTSTEDLKKIVNGQLNECKLCLIIMIIINWKTASHSNIYLTIKIYLYGSVLNLDSHLENFF